MHPLLTDYSLACTYFIQQTLLFARHYRDEQTIHLKVQQSHIPSWNKVGGIKKKKKLRSNTT